MAAASRQHVAWLMNVGRQSMDAREVTTIDGEAVAAIMAAAGVEHADAAAEAVKNLATETTI